MVHLLCLLVSLLFDQLPDLIKPLHPEHDAFELHGLKHSLHRLSCH